MWTNGNKCKPIENSKVYACKGHDDWQKCKCLTSYGLNHGKGETIHFLVISEESYKCYSLVLNTSHGVFPENCDQANFCMDITLLIPSRSWWDYKGHFQLALTGYTLNIRMIDKEMTELWHLKVCRVSYSSVSCIRDQRVSLDVLVLYLYLYISQLPTVSVLSSNWLQEPSTVETRMDE